MSHKKKIYIAGKVSGEDKLKCAAKFDKAAKKIEALGFEAVNPLEVVGTWDISWAKAMRKSITAMLKCDAIVLLSDHFLSKGAKIEEKLAKSIRMEVFQNISEIK